VGKIADLVMILVVLCFPLICLLEFIVIFFRFIQVVFGKIGGSDDTEQLGFVLLFGVPEDGQGVRKDIVIPFVHKVQGRNIIRITVFVGFGTFEPLKLAQCCFIFCVQIAQVGIVVNR